MAELPPLLREALSSVLTYSHDGKPVTMADVQTGAVRYVPDPQTGEMQLRRWRQPKKRSSTRPRCGARCRDGHECKARCVALPVALPEPFPAFAGSGPGG